MRTPPLLADFTHTRVCKPFCEKYLTLPKEPRNNHTASGAERAYRKAVEHLAYLLTEAEVLHIIRLKRKSQTKRKKKIAAAVYLYQVDNDGEWGEISFDFEAGTAEIIRLAEWDTTISKVFATKVVALVMKDGDYQTKESILAVSC